MQKSSFKKKMRANGAGWVAVWTGFIAALTCTTLYLHHQDTLKAAASEARDYFRLNEAYRSWAASLGGVYAPVEKVAPNPFLHTPKRDIATADGQRLTLMNPAYMTRLVFEREHRSSGNPVISKITSLNPINPSNAADPWEREALDAFQRGPTTERAQVADLNGRPYLRFIRRFITEQACLACHESQGYRLGDVRGAIAISIPLTEYLAAETKTRQNLVGGYLLLWLVGGCGIVASSRRRCAIEDALREQEEKFRTVCDWTQDWEYWVDEHGRMKYVAPSCLEITGYSVDDFLREPGLVRRIVHPEDSPAFEEHLQNSHRELPENSLEFRIVTKLGEERWMHHGCRPVFSGGRFLGRRVSNRDVTDRKLAQREVAIRAELLNSVNDSVLVLDRQGRILDSNHTTWRTRGLSRDQLLSMNICELNVDPQWSAERVEEIFREGSACFETEHRLADGGTIHVEVNSRVIDYRGEPAALSCIRDITARKETETNLRRSERFNLSLNRISAFLAGRGDRQLYQELLTPLLEITESPVGLVGFIGADGELVCPSPAGVVWQTAHGQQTELILPSQSWGDSSWGECLRSGEACYQNSPQKVFPGEAEIKRCLAVPLLSEGRSIGLFLVGNRGRDYNEDDLQMLKAVAVQVAPVLQARLEQQQAEAALRENESKLRVIFDVVQAGIVQVDEEGVITFANQRMAEMLGMPLEELVGSGYLSHVDPEQLERSAAGLRQLLEGKVEYVHVERRYQRKDGGYFWGYLSGRRLFGPNLKHPMLVGAISDLTELKSAQEKRRRSEQQMLHVQKLESLGVLAGGIAHDFNNILLAIMGNASLALHRTAPGSPAEIHLRQIEKAAEKAADLARQMLAYSGKGRFVLEALDLNQLVLEMGSMLEVSISKKAELRFDLAERLPTIVADPTQLRQIVMNLAINASEAIGELSGLISISTGSQECESGDLAESWLNDDLPAGLYVFLEVTDTGCGMSPKTVERIFEPFFTTKFTGRGLGMSAILGIVRGHKGAIKVFTEIGKGSSFRVYFPASDLSVEVQEAPSVDDGWRGEGTVLLVDDEDAVRGIGADMLRELGFRVLTADDGSEALQMYRARKGEINLVLMDMNMPRLSGEEAFHELRKIDPSVRVILSSGFSEQEVTGKFLGQGLAGFVQKPYTLDTLRDVLTRLM